MMGWFRFKHPLICKINNVKRPQSSVRLEAVATKIREHLKASLDFNRHRATTENPPLTESTGFFAKSMGGGVSSQQQVEKVFLKTNTFSDWGKKQCRKQQTFA